MNFTFPVIETSFYIAALPVLLMCVGSIIAMLQGVSKKYGSEAGVFSVLIVTLLAALLSCFWNPVGAEISYFGGSYLAGELGRFGQILIIVISIVIALVYRETFLREKFFRGEIASLFLMIAAGMLVMASSEDLITLFVGLELSSIGLYAVVGYLNPSRRSQEGAIKYFVLGSFAAAILLFGFGLLYAATGSMRISEIIASFPHAGDNTWIGLGAIFTVTGLGFKLALAPFHLWAPDTYEAAPTGITAFMATSVKVMIVIVAMRFFSDTTTSLFEAWMPAMMFLAILSMIIGNIMALVQNSLKRMLAYSSVAHSGYMAVAICALGGASGSFPVAAVLFYVMGYTIISVGAFGIIMWLESDDNDNLLLDDISGLARKHPWASFALAVFMFSFAGMPPTVGFIAKFFVFNAALANQLYSLVIIGVIGSSIAFFYYLRVIVRMYMTEPLKVAVPLTPSRSVVLSIIMAASIIMSILLGTVLPGPALRSIMETSVEVARK